MYSMAATYTCKILSTIHFNFEFNLRYIIKWESLLNLKIKIR